MDHKVITQAAAGPADNPRGHWPEWIQQEFDENSYGPGVGNQLAFENERCRVWHLNLPAGGWLTFHRHVLDYFWSAVTSGVARGYYEDGRIQDVHHYAGETMFFNHGKDEYFVHAIENVGDTHLIFVTVEFLPGDNPPIHVPDSYRIIPPADVVDDHAPTEA